MAGAEARMRTVDGVYKYCGEKDPQTAVNPTMLRRLLKENKIKYVKIGAKYLINLDLFEAWLLNPVEMIEQPKTSGVLRKIM